MNEEVLNVIANGLKRENRYCKELQNLGIRVRDGSLIPDASVVPTMVDQPANKSLTILSVMNCRRTGTMTLQVTTTDGSISNVSMESDMVEGLCFLLLFTHGEPGYTNDMKSYISPADYIMSRLLMPEKIGAEYMIAVAKYEGVDIIDRHTGERSVRNSDDIENMEEIYGKRYLRINRFMMMSRLAQYWVLDFFSRIRDQRLSVIDQLRDRIMMGQQRQKRRIYNVAEDIEIEERRGAGYVEESKRDTFLPDSVHGSRHHMSALAKNALVLVSEYGPLHVFLTLTCNPDWPEIKSQLLVGQSAFDRPDVTVTVFKSRLDQIKANIRHGKYFGS